MLNLSTYFYNVSSDKIFVTFIMLLYRKLRNSLLVSYNIPVS